MRYYILRYGESENYVGEARTHLLSPNGEYIRAGTYEVVDDIQKAVPIPENKVEEIMNHFSLPLYYRQYQKPLRRLNYIFN